LPPCYLWVGLVIHIVYGPADPHIIQITIILILSYALIHFGCLQLENDGDFLYLLADAAAILKTTAKHTLFAVPIW
jgi:hypothetical protein